MKKIIPIVLLVVVLVGGYFVYQAWQESEAGKNISPEEKEFNDSGRAKAILDETDLWQYYEDPKTGLSIKYPGNVGFGADETFPHLSFQSGKIDFIEGTMSFNKETALENQESLKNGEYGQAVDWPLAESKKVRKIGDVYAQEFMVLMRFEVCDVTFVRKLYFLYNGYQVVITLTGPKEEIVNSSPEYFEINKDNCGDQKVWNYEKQKDFFNNLENKAGVQVAQDWFDLFDKITGTIAFNQALPDSAVLLQGKWKSTDDVNSVIEFKGYTKIDYYSGDKMSEGYFQIDNDQLIVRDNNNGESYEYTIVDLSAKALNLTYLPRGNTLKYEKE